MSDFGEVIGYKMVYGLNPDHLEEEMQVYLSKGWKPLGGPIVYGQDIYQAITPVGGNYTVGQID